MQPTLPQSTGAADMDLPAVQSMDWLFKKERIYLLAQFWQQVSTLKLFSSYFHPHYTSFLVPHPNGTSSMPFNAHFYPCSASFIQWRILCINANRKYLKNEVRFCVVCMKNSKSKNYFKKKRKISVERIIKSGRGKKPIIFYFSSSYLTSYKRIHIFF